MTLSELVRGRRLLVCVGPGGVGKTTLAAAIALEAARGGRRVAVITIDPARRLADALGLDGLDDALRPVAGLRGEGSLDAAMLDTKASYDALITRITQSPAARDRILTNRVYQAFSRTLARSHAYVAMERLHDVLTDGDYDLIVLDTPPTRSALDILDAPARLVRFLDDRVLSAFVGELEGGAKAWVKAQSTKVALRLFGRMVGDALMAELAGFFEVFLHLRTGFAQRAEVVRQTLQQEGTAFVLVTAPRATHLHDAGYLRDGLRSRGVPVEVILFNRAFHDDGRGQPLYAGTSEQRVVDRAAPHADVRDAGRRLRARLAAQNAEMAERARAFTDESAGPTLAQARFPILAEEPTSLDELVRLLERAAPV